MRPVSKISGMIVAFALILSPVVALGQGSQVAFGNTQKDRDLPVEVTADNLSVNQADNTATFTGNVVIGQGEMRLAAPRVLVVYLADQSGIESLEATGGVTLASGEDAAEAERANYNITTGMIEMRGNVLLVQGSRAITGETMVVDTSAGTAQVSGRVKTILQPSSSE